MWTVATFHRLIELPPCKSKSILLSWTRFQGIKKEDQPHFALRTTILCCLCKCSSHIKYWIYQMFQIFALREPSPFWLAYYSPKNLGKTFLGEHFTWSVVDPLMVLQNSCVFICQSCQSVKLHAPVFTATSLLQWKWRERKEGTKTMVVLMNWKTCCCKLYGFLKTEQYCSGLKKPGIEPEKANMALRVNQLLVMWQLWSQLWTGANFPIWGCSALHY